MTTLLAPRSAEIDHMAATAIITTEKLSKTFSNAGVQQHVLKNLDLVIEEGSFTVIMGPLWRWQVHAAVCAIRDGPSNARFGDLR